MTPAQIKHVRESLQMTQTEFAAEIGVNLRTVQKWEGDERKPVGMALAALRRLADRVQAAEFAGRGRKSGKT